ncbi:MAG: hypothetical protein QXL51_07965 [Candidatus Aenigmatarchaeota archaeon]
MIKRFISHEIEYDNSEKKMAQIQIQTPNGAGGKAASNVKLGPRQKWVLALLFDQKELFLYEDKSGGWSLEEAYRARTRSAIYAPYNMARVAYGLEKKGLVEIKYLPCPFHHNHKKKFVSLTPEGERVALTLPPFE